MKIIEIVSIDGSKVSLFVNKICAVMEKRNGTEQMFSLMEMASHFKHMHLITM